MVVVVLLVLVVIGWITTTLHLKGKLPQIPQYKIRCCSCCRAKVKLGEITIDKTDFDEVV